MTASLSGDPEFVRLIVGEYRDALSSGAWPTGSPRQAADVCDFLIQGHARGNAYFADCALLLILEYQAPVTATAKRQLAEAAQARLDGQAGGTPAQASRYRWHREAYFYMARLIFHGMRLQEASMKAAAALDLGSKGKFFPKASTLERDYTARWRAPGVERAFFEELSAQFQADDPAWIELIQQLPSVTKESRIGKRR